MIITRTGVAAAATGRSAAAHEISASRIPRRQVTRMRNLDACFGKSSPSWALNACGVLAGCGRFRKAETEEEHPTFAHVTLSPAYHRIVGTRLDGVDRESPPTLTRTPSMAGPSDDARILLILLLDELQLLDALTISTYGPDGGEDEEAAAQQGVHAPGIWSSGLRDHQ
jgi:hypothetical protein